MNKKVAIIGGGASALFCASFLDQSLFDISIYDRNKALGRKFLVAGKGGFNLSHGNDIHDMFDKYSPTEFLREALMENSNIHMRDWLAEIGIQTIIGSSGKIYPEKSIKPIEVLNAIKEGLVSKGVELQYNKMLKTWKRNEITFSDGECLHPDIIIFALGGGSWKVTGSDGLWTITFLSNGINIEEFVPMNCAFSIDWINEFMHSFHGSPVKNINIKHEANVAIGEVVITKNGIEGGAIYALSESIQSQLIHGSTTIYLDMKPMFDSDKIEAILTLSKLSTTQTLTRSLKLSKVKIALLKHYLSKEEFNNKKTLARLIKSFPLDITKSASLDEAISTKGGISIHELDENFQLNKFENHFCIGEMVDWNTITGGYLLQGCYSMGTHLAKYLNSSNSDNF